MAQHETPIQAKTRIRQASLLAAKGKAAASSALAGKLEGTLQSGLESLDKTTQVGQSEIRRRSAERLSGALQGAAKTGAGARLAAARSLTPQSLSAEQTFQAAQAARKTGLEQTAAKDIAAAGKAGEEANLEALRVESELATLKEDETKRLTTALSTINAQMPQFEGLIYDSNRDAGRMVENVALQYDDLDPDLAAGLRRLANRISTGLLDIGSGFTVSAEMLQV